MNFKLREKFENEHFIKSLMKEYFIVVTELALLALNILKNIRITLESSFSLSKKYEEHKTHNMFF